MVAEGLHFSPAPAGVVLGLTSAPLLSLLASVPHVLLAEMEYTAQSPENATSICFVRRVLLCAAPAVLLRWGSS